MVTYVGSSEQDRIEAALHYDRITNLIERLQRMGFAITAKEIESFQFCIDVLTIPDQEPEPVPAVTPAPTPAPAHAPQERTRRIRPVE